jgi:hypothetical protein
MPNYRDFAIVAIAMLISEQAMAQGAVPPKVQCEKFKKQADGSWTSAPDAMWGTAKFSSNSGIRPGAYKLNGSDVGAVLDAKCSGAK